MKKAILALLTLLCLLVAAQSVSAQTPTGWQLQVFQVGVNPLATPAPSPFYTLDLPSSIITCNSTQTMPTQTAAPVNPKEVWWTHPALPGQVCKGDLSGQTAFIAMPVGGPYPVSLVATNAAGVSPRKVADFPFTRLDPASAPTSVLLK